MKVTITHGSKKYEIEIDEKSVINELLEKVEQVSGIPVSAQKLIYKGKTIQALTESVADAGIKDRAKLMLIGRQHHPEEEALLEQVESREKTVDKQEKSVEELSLEIDGISKGWLTGSQKHEACQKLSKRIAAFTEEFMKTLEHLDGITFDEHFRTARTRKRSLVCRVQKLLERLDVFEATVEQLIADEKQT